MKVKQISFGASGFELSSKTTRKRVFLDEMIIVVPWCRGAVVPWAELVGLIQPHAPAGKTGRPPFSVETLLRIHFMQQWFSLSDPAMQEALHDTPLYCEFARLDSGMSRLSDESTILRFRRLLEVNDLAPQIMTTVNALLSARGVLLKAGTAVDATLIAAPRSTKNKDAARDPEMHQTKKGNQWHFGMKAHIGVDADFGLVHTVIGTAANVHDVTQANALLHGQESSAHGDPGYQGANKRPNARQDFTWYVAMRPGKRRALDKANAMIVVAEKIEKLKTSVRAKVEHPFRVIKRQFGRVKVRYRELKKNTAQLHTLFALSNLWMVRGKLMAQQA